MTALAIRPTSTEIVSIDGARRIPSEAWNALARRGFHLHAWCLAAERAGWRGRHVVVSGIEGIRAIVPAYLVGDGVPHDLHDRWLGPLRAVAGHLGLALRPVLSVQTPFAQCSDPLGDGDALDGGALNRVFEALESAAARGGARAVVWPHVDAGRQDLIDAARARGYAVVYAGASARLAVRWASFDEYVRSRSKSVRRTIQCDLRALERSGLRTEWRSDFLSAAPAMDVLWREAFHHRNGRPAPTGPDMIARLADGPVPEIAAQLAWDGGRLVGMSLNLRAGGAFDGTFAAFTADQRGGPVYYDDLCYEPLRRACAEGCGVIELGASALYAKVLRGATLRRRVTLIRGTSRALHRTLVALGTLAGRRTDAKEREALGALWGARCFAEEGA